MRILCFINSLSSGGAERQLVGLSVMLKQCGYDVVVCTYKDNNFYQDILTSKDIEHISLRTDCSVRRLLRTIQFIRRYRGDVVISYLEQPSTFCCIAKLFSKFKLIVSERNTTQTLSLNTKIRFWLYRFADWIVPNSNTQGKYIIKNYSEYSSKVKVITNYTDIHKFIPPKNKIQSPLIRFVVVARITPQKNIPIFAEAVSKLKELGASFIVDWYGNPLNEEYGHYCNEYIKYKGISDVFRIHPATSDIIVEYQTSNCFVLPSKYEGYPNVVCEAMSCGLPILCSNVCDNSDIVQNGVNGYLFDPNNADDIASKMMLFLQTECNRVDIMGHESRKIAEALFSKEEFISKYIKLIESQNGKKI